MDYRSGFITLLGRTNVGKSTLINTILGEKISIISKKPQTTRNRILGIKTDDESQMIFIDTPGIHRGEKGLNRFMIKTAMAAKDDADVITVMVEAGESPDAIDRGIIGELGDDSPLTILLINKVDIVKKTVILPLIDELNKLFPFEKIIPISALRGDGVPEYLSEVKNLLPISPPFFPDDALTDVSERFIAGEIIREKVFNLTHQEIPYAVAVSVEEFKEDEERNLLKISAVIYVERESQKGILIGKGGSLIKKVGSIARADLELFFNIRIYLDLRVKVLKDWAKREEALKRLGYI
jgi:GTP-binding protein Era